jgi:hypothetical protein
VQLALEEGRLKGDEALPASVRVQITALDLNLTFEEDITLE